ncbi:MAG: T9SS type A sorting domain-containing protein [Bacteroidia bacterium]|nr:T9SS type A sorting domain-containing protein [Bacteroidia bacterium]
MSYNAAGNNQIQYSGVCQNDFYFFDFWPSLVFDRVDIFMQFALTQSTGASLQIIDSYGNQAFLKLLNNVSSDFPYIESLDLSALESGVYIFIIQANGVYKRRKFVKHNYF